ncbi:MAG: hypothetical protein WD824_12345 [Cyclobacteriaceae bacterium]
MPSEDVTQIREILELGALRLAYDKNTPEQIARLEKICEADLKFHETLMECSGNGKLLQTYNNSQGRGTARNIVLLRR